jgi:hypothetical protein
VIEVKGNGRVAHYVTLTPSTNGLVIRIEEQEDPGYWMEICLSKVCLWRMARMVGVTGDTRVSHPKPARRAGRPAEPEGGAL